MSLSNWILRSDREISKALFQTQFASSATSTKVWLFLEQTGHGWIWFPLAAVGIASEGGWKWKFLMVSLLVDIACVGIVKATFARDRPSYNKKGMLMLGPDRHSFPSGYLPFFYLVQKIFRPFNQSGDGFCDGHFAFASATPLFRIDSLFDKCCVHYLDFCHCNFAGVSGSTSRH